MPLWAIGCSVHSRFQNVILTLLHRKFNQIGKTSKSRALGLHCKLHYFVDLLRNPSPNMMRKRKKDLGEIQGSEIFWAAASESDLKCLWSLDCFQKKPCPVFSQFLLVYLTWTWHCSSLPVLEQEKNETNSQHSEGKSQHSGESIFNAQDREKWREMQTRHKMKDSAENWKRFLWLFHVFKLQNILVDN